MIVLDDEKNNINNEETKELFTDVEKLNFEIDDLESQINLLYVQIGQQYFDMHYERPEKELEGLIMSVLEKMKCISNLRNKISKKKDTVICEKCGAEMKKNAMYCTNCGYRINGMEKVIPEGYIQCSKCGYMIEDTSIFCSNCGNKTEKEDRKFTESEIQNNKGKKFCYKCGKKMEVDEFYCYQCGTKAE